MFSDRLKLHVYSHFHSSIIPKTRGHTNRLLLNSDITVGIYDHGGMSNFKYITVLTYTVLCV